MAVAPLSGPCKIAVPDSRHRRRICARTDTNRTGSREPEPPRCQRDEPRRGARGLHNIEVSLGSVFSSLSLSPAAKPRSTVRQKFLRQWSKRQIGNNTLALPTALIENDLVLAAQHPFHRFE